MAEPYTLHAGDHVTHPDWPKATVRRVVSCHPLPLTGNRYSATERSITLNEVAHYPPDHPHAPTRGGRAEAGLDLYWMEAGLVKVEEAIAQTLFKVSEALHHSNKWAAEVCEDVRQMIKDAMALRAASARLEEQEHRQYPEVASVVQLYGLELNTAPPDVLMKIVEYYMIRAHKRMMDHSSAPEKEAKQAMLRRITELTRARNTRTKYLMDQATKPKPKEGRTK